MKEELLQGYRFDSDESILRLQSIRARKKIIPTADEWLTRRTECSRIIENVNVAKGTMLLKALWILLLISPVFGAFALAFSLERRKRQEILAVACTVQATVLESNGTLTEMRGIEYHTRVRYRFQAREYEVEFYSSQGHDEEKPLTLYLNPENPSEFEIPGCTVRLY